MAVLRMAREATYKGHHEVKVADPVFSPAAPRLAHGRRCQRVETNTISRDTTHRDYPFMITP